MPDIFGYDRKPNQNVLASTEASAITAGSGKVGLAQNVQLTYTQNVTDIFEIGSSDMFWIGGRPVGDGTIARLVSTKAGFASIQEEMQLCKGGATLTIAFGIACSGSGATSSNSDGGTVTLGSVVMLSKNYGMDTRDLLVNENLRIRFASMTEAGTK